MTEKQVYQEADHLSDYIIQMMERTEAGVPECLTIMSAAVDQVIRSLCKVIEEDPEQMITVFCNALQQGLEKERHYSTGSKEGDDLMAKMVAEVKAGGNVEEIVDRYVDCKTPELRQQVISGIRQMVGNHMLDNVNIGY